MTHPKLSLQLHLMQLTTSFSSVQSLSCDRLFVTPWTAARQASLSITNSWSLLKLMSTELMMATNQLILSPPSSPAFNIFPASGSFPMSQFFASGGQSIGVSASASVSELQHWSFQWIWPCGQCYVNIVGSPHWWNMILQPGCIRCFTCPGEKIGRKQNSGSFEVGLEDCSDVEEYWILAEGSKIELIRWEELQKKSKFLNVGSIPLRVRVK